MKLRALSWRNVRKEKVGVPAQPTDHVLFLFPVTFIVGIISQKNPRGLFFIIENSLQEYFNLRYGRPLRT
jgi:hypothetical protein